MSLIDPNDPRLTAYALDEMSPREKASFELQLRADPAAQAAVEDIRKAAATLSAALEREPAPESVIEPPRIADSRRRVRRPWLYLPIPYFLGTVAVAALALAFFWRDRTTETEAQLAAQQREIQLLLEASEKAAAAEKLAAAPRPAALEPSPASSRVGTVEIGVPLDVVSPATLASPIPTGFDPLVLAPITAPALQLPPRIPTTLPTTIASAHTPLATSYNLFPAGAPAIVTFSKPIEITLQPDPLPLRENSPWSRTTGANSTRVAALNYSRAALPVAPAVTATATTPVEPRRSPPKATDRTLPALPSPAAAGAAKFRLVNESPLSAFNVDAEVASLSVLRHLVAEGALPPASAVRIEELLNCFPPETAEPAGDNPLRMSVEMHPAPWAPDHQLVRLGFRARNLPASERPAVNLVLVLDVSASTLPGDTALDSVRIAVRELLAQLQPDDRVALLARGHDGSITLESMPAGDRATLLETLPLLAAGRPFATTMASLHSAYQMARREFLPRGINRVVLFSRGGTASSEQLPAGLEQLVNDHAQLGIALNTVVVGGGPAHDSVLERLARRGQGRCATATTPADAARMGPQLALFTRPTRAEDVRVQIEFNPARVQAYRQIGYESRAVAPEGAAAPAPGESALVAGETVTVLYEIIPVDSPLSQTLRPPALKYQAPVPVTEKVSDDWLTVNVHYRIPRGPAQELAYTVTGAAANAFPEMSRDFRFTAAAAAFGLLLRDSPDKGGANWPLVESLASEAIGNDATAPRAEFLELVRRAKNSAAKL